MRGSWTLSCSIRHASSTELRVGACRCRLTFGRLLQVSPRANEVPSSLRRLEIQNPSRLATGTVGRLADCASLN